MKLPTAFQRFKTGKASFLPLKALQSSIVQAYVAVTLMMPSLVFITLTYLLRNYSLWWAKHWLETQEAVDFYEYNGGETETVRAITITN
ncbi:hypothetical protein [Methylomicrobium album]|uniref:hypothetical protein n=1 Tax=Methylomicrobium album TaxID=39775 RepID=UPI00058E0A8E|nr:hypothetical protein [Methylomicrobium album]